MSSPPHYPYDDLPAVVRGRRPSTSWVTVSRGLHREPDPAGFLADLRAWSHLLPAGSCFTHVTAMQARGLWMPQLLPGAPVFVSIPRDRDRLRRPGLRIIRHTSPVSSRQVAGVRLATTAEALLVCARDLSLLDLVLVIDGALQLGAAGVDELVELSRTRRWGAPALRRALALADARSESPWETVLRLFHLCADIAVEPQVDIHDAAGSFVARADLLVVGRRWLHEYDGAVHRGRLEHCSDLRRDRALLGAGCIRRGFTSDELTTRSAATLRELDEALERSPDAGRLARWHRMLDPSTLTWAGRRRLAHRWRS